jgi:signal transduction histidine kinase
MNRRSRRRLFYSAAAVSLLIAVSVGVYLYFERPGYGLPFRPRLTPDAEDRWTALGGVWNIVDGSVRNDSNDRGAKLLTGSPTWRDYTVEGEVQLLGVGSVGLLARVSEAEVGENSYRGYLAGVRSVDNSLFLGVFDFDYHEASKIRLPDPVRPLRWYRVRLRVDGCRIDASVSTAGMPELRTATLNDPDCFRSGLVGLRSNGTGGVWRNFVVAPAGSRVSFTPETPQSWPQSTAQPLLRRAAESRDVQSVRSLQYLGPFGASEATVRGSVVLTRPAIYIEDSTGGVQIQTSDPVLLKVGDTVEVTGEVNLDGFAPVIRKPRLRLISESVPIPPAVLTANQVATGWHDGTFVQVEGYLRSVSASNDGSMSLVLDAGTQSFRVQLPAGRSRSRLRNLSFESRLRAAGIAVVHPLFNKYADPFVILARSAEDVEMVAGPPWWRPSNLILAGLVALALVFTSNHLYLLAKHWRLRAVAEERERLAHEIHDTLAQSFAGIGFQLQAIRNSIPGNDRLLRGQVDRAMLMARTSHEEARRSIANLRPKSLGSTGLLPALRECAEGMVRNGAVRVETHGEEEGRFAPPRIRDTLFRIGQEAIANAIRHANAAVIRICLRQQGPILCLSVEDDGGGFTADSEHAGFGLLGMRKRAESINATLTILSSPGSGTRVEVRAAAGSRLRSALQRRRA